MGRSMGGGIWGLLNANPASRYIDDALGVASTKTVNSTGFFDRLLSFFGKADYNFGEKYYASVTVRRDGSSKLDRKSTRLNSSHDQNSYAVFCLKKKNNTTNSRRRSLARCGRQALSNPTPLPCPSARAPFCVHSTTPSPRLPCMSPAASPHPRFQ